jgi:hypothetical protein
MNWYDMIFGFDNRSGRHFLADGDELFGHDLFDLSDGTVIANWNSKSLLRSTKREYDGPPDDILENSLVVPVFSARLRASLAQGGVGGGDLQYLPIRVFQSTGEELPGFAVANVVTRIRGPSVRNTNRAAAA